MEKPEPVTFISFCAIEGNYLYIAAKPDTFDSEEEFTRLFFYDKKNKLTPWLHHDLPNWSVVSTCSFKKSPTSTRMYCALSKQGQIEYCWPGGSKAEEIPGAGLLRADNPIYGYVKCIKQIGDFLYVCGSGGQVYRRDENSWSHIAEPLKYPARPLKPSSNSIDENIVTHDFSWIDGYSENDLYVIGGRGAVFHFDGKNWKKCKSSSSEILTYILCRPNNEVWICGFNGTLLRGNAASGFKELSRYDDNMNFSSMSSCGAITYLSSNEGLHYYDERRKKIHHIEKIADINNFDANYLDCADGILWSVGHKDIISFDGKKWKRLDHPDNPPIR